MKKMSPLIFVSLLFSATSAHAEDREWVAYKKLIETIHLDKFYQVNPIERDKLRMLFKVEPENKAILPSGVVLTVIHGGVHDILPHNSDGMMELEPNPQWIREDAMIYTNLPKGEKSRISAIFAAKTPQSLQLSYAELTASVPQWNIMIKEQAGILRFMLPKFNAVLFHFSKPNQSTLQIVARDGTHTYTADSKGDLELKLNDALLKDNPQVLLSEKPSWVEVDEI